MRRYRQRRSSVTEQGAAMSPEHDLCSMSAPHEVSARHHRLRKRQQRARADRVSMTKRIPARWAAVFVAAGAIRGFAILHCARADPGLGGKRGAAEGSAQPEAVRRHVTPLTGPRQPSLWPRRQYPAIFYSQITSPNMRRFTPPATVGSGIAGFEIGHGRLRSGSACEQVREGGV